MNKSILSLLLILHCPAWGFGVTGHRVVAAIAQQQLNADTQACINQLIAPQNLVHVANWADQIRSDPQWQHSGPWHYINIEQGATLAQSQRNPKGDILAKLDEFSLQFTQAQSRQQRQQALYFLVHLVADIHNPLHVAYAKDRGGNNITLRFMGQRTNLHRLWDSGLIRHSQLSYSEYVALLDIHPVSDYKQWQGQPFTTWLEDSRSLLPTVYHFSGTKLGLDYYDQQQPYLEQQLLKAGIRLADLLHQLCTKKLSHE